MTSSGPVLVLTGRNDITADLVVHELNGRSVPVARLDPSDFPTDMSLAASLHDLRWEGRIRTADGLDVDLATVRSVYYRRPGRPLLPATMSDAEREWALREAIHGLFGVLGSLDCLYVNHPSMNQAAEFKARQLAVAARCGLRFPSTLLTNDPDEARAFAKDVRAVMKPLRDGFLVEHGARKAAYTTAVDDDEIDDSVRFTVHQLQAWIEKSHDVRLTVVGDRMFAVEIHSGSPAARVDFRADYDALTYRVTDAPAEVAAGVRAMMDRLGLVFAAIDFAVTVHGEWVFLGDVNPNGQWAWIEKHLPELRIAAAIADVLERGAA